MVHLMLQREFQMCICVALTALAVDVSVELSLEKPVFDDGSLFVVRNVQEGVIL